jgi:phospholipase/carboxylesterase
MASLRLAGFDYIFVPGSSDKTLLLLHGTGGDELDLVPVGQSIDPTASLVSPRGNVIENGAPRFFKRLAEGVYDVTDLAEQSGSLADFVRAAAETHRLDLARTCIVGYSNGANIAIHLMLTQPHLVKNAILFRPLYQLEVNPIPTLTDTAILQVNGQSDPIIPTTASDSLHQLLVQTRATVTYELLPTGHQLTEADLRIARHWYGATLA